MRKIFLSVFVIILATVGAAHAALDKEVATCAAKAGDLERLECYDKLARRHKLDVPTLAPAPTTGVGKWSVRDERNPIDDTRTVSLSLIADSGASKWDKPVVLFVRCQSNETDMFIVWNDYLGMGTSRVTARVGSARAETKSWLNSTDNQATFYPSSVIGYVKKMMASPSFVAQVTPYNESPVTVTFDLTGMSNALAPLRETCKW
tara:strand:+ start:6083 stop:6697 length:615 start_codon:yes stop_codon:yes gene_type:complete